MSQNDFLYVRLRLQGTTKQEFLKLQKHHGIETNSELLRFLIRKEARDLGLAEAIDDALEEAIPVD